jgi:hypothetical protein
MEPLDDRWYLHLTRKKGKPFPSPTYITEWLKMKTHDMVEKDLVWESLCCCVCWEAPLFNSKVNGHAALACPLVASFNKVHSQANLSPIVIAKLGFVACVTHASRMREATCGDQVFVGVGDAL